jgi:chromosome segregation ATPase
MISKKIMNKAIELEKEFKLKDIMYYQMLLEMHNGSLENFMCNPDTQLQRFIDQKRQSINGFCYMAIDTKWSDLENMYKLYANEMSTVFKAEKITGALSFLEKLKTLTPHFQQIQNYIDGINNLNNKLRPEIEEMMENIQSDIDRITKELEAEEKYLIELKDKIRPYTENLEEILKGKSAEEIKELTQSFKDENPDFAELDEEKDKQERKISTLKSEKQERTKLFNRLEDCVGRIESHFAA